MSILSHPSVDTVRFFLPCSHEDIDSFPFAIRSVNAYFNPGGREDSPARLTWYPFTSSELDRLPSSHSMPALSPHYDPDSPGIKLQLSIPKLLRGHSGWHPGPDDLESAAFGVFQALKRVWSSCPEVKTWRVMRLDLSVNLDCGRLEQVNSFKTVLSRLRYRGNPAFSSGKKKVHFAYWKGSHKTLKFYSKGLEYLGTDDFSSKKVLDALGDNSRGFEHELLKILRFEVEYHRKGLLRALDAHSRYDLGFFSVLAWYRDLDFNIWFQSYLKQFDRPGPLKTLTELENLVSRLPKSEVYRDFIRQIIDFGLDDVQKRTKKTTFYYRIKQLRSVGIEPQHLDTHFNYFDDTQAEDVLPLGGLPIHSGLDTVLDRDDFSMLVSSLVHDNVLTFTENIFSENSSGGFKSAGF